MHILSFDIEEWFLSRNTGRIPVSRWNTLTGRLVNNTRRILDLCNMNGVKATFFILGWVAEKYPGLVREIQQGGHDIGYHSFEHQRLGQMNVEQLDLDLTKGLAILQNISGHPIFHSTGKPPGLLNHC